jgi:hypothetical protein
MAVFKKIQSPELDALYVKKAAEIRHRRELEKMIIYGNPHDPTVSCFYFEPKKVNNPRDKPKIRTPSELTSTSKTMASKINNMKEEKNVSQNNNLSR